MFDLPPFHAAFATSQRQTVMLFIELRPAFATVPEHQADTKLRYARVLRHHMRCRLIHQRTKSDQISWIHRDRLQDIWSDVYVAFALIPCRNELDRRNLERPNCAQRDVIDGCTVLNAAVAFF